MNLFSITVFDLRYFYRFIKFIVSMQGGRIVKQCYGLIAIQRSQIQRVFQPNQSTYACAAISASSPWQDLARASSSQTSNSASNDVLSNDRLVKHLLSQNGMTSGESLIVRVITESPNPDEKASHELISLNQAIRKSIEMECDLVSVDITQDVPVLRIADLKSLLYRQTKKVLRNKKLNKSLPVKEVQFNTGIEQNDFGRKVDLILDYCEKGHTCQVSIRAKTRTAREDPESAQKFVTKIIEMTANELDFIKEPSFNEEKTKAEFIVRSSRTSAK